MLSDEKHVCCCVTLRVCELFFHGKIIPDLPCAPQGVTQFSMMFGTTHLILVLSLNTRYFHNVVSVNNYGNHNEALKCIVDLHEFTINTCSANAILEHSGVPGSPWKAAQRVGSGTEKWLSGSLLLPKGCGDACASLLVFLLVELIFLFSLSCWKDKESSHNVCICWRIVYKIK